MMRRFTFVVLAGVIASGGCQHSASTPRSDGRSSTAGVVLDGAPYQRVDVQANTFTMSSQDAVVVGIAPDDSAIVAWQSRRQEFGLYGIYAQRLAPDGSRLGGEVHINETAPGAQTRPAVAVTPDGTVWCAWESFGQDGDRGTIMARRFTVDLHPLGGEFQVNTEGTGHQAEPSIAALDDGGAVVVWTTPLAAPQHRAVHSRRILPDGRLGSEVRVDDGAAVSARLPAVVADAQGRNLIAWATATPDDPKSRIAARWFDGDGNPLSPARVISPADGAMHIEPAIATTRAGQALIAWLTAAGEDYAIQYQRCDLGGTLTGSRQWVERDGHDYPMGLAAAIDGADQPLLIWTSYRHGSEDHPLVAARFRSGGDVLDPPFIVTAARSGRHQVTVASGAQRAACTPSGRIAVAWAGGIAGGDNSAAALTWLSPLGLTATPTPWMTRGAENAAIPHEPPKYTPGPKLRREDILSAELGMSAAGFPGNAFTGWNPPDPSLAVGPNHIVQVVNGEICFYTKTGTELECDALENTGGFWGSVGATMLVFDPEVLYDPDSGRFFAVANERAPLNVPHLLLAVSDDSNPVGTWHKYRMNVVGPAGAGSIDSPNMAVSDDVVYLSADFLGAGARYFVYMLPKEPLLSGTLPPATSLLMPGVLSLGLPQTFGDTAAQHLVEALMTVNATSLKLHAILDPLTTPTVQSFTLPVPSYSPPEDPPSAGTSLRASTFDARIWHCMMRDGSLWATHHVNSTSVRVRWYEIAMNGWPTSGQNPALVQSGEITPNPGVRTTFSSIWADPDGTVALTYTRSSPTEFLNMAYSAREPGDPLGTLPTSGILVESSQPLGPTSNRWGDYSGITHDPVEPGRFWATGEYKILADGWATRLADFVVVEPPPVSITADIKLSPTMAAGTAGDPINRCIDFELSTCAPGSPTHLFSTVVTFGAPDNERGEGTAVFEVPAGDWQCITARDPLHTLGATCPLACAANACTAEFTASPLDDDTCHWLIGGNLDGDGVIDIFDYTLLSAEYLTVIDDDSPCGTAPTHADINGDGMVSLADFGFILFYFLQATEEGCDTACGPGPTPPAITTKRPRTSVTVRELRERGLVRQATTADADGNGVVDVKDIAAFIRQRRAAAPAADPELDRLLERVDPADTPPQGLQKP